MRDGRVGCAECYKTFYNELKPSIQRIHGQVHHNGKIASTVETVNADSDTENEIENLKLKMDEAIKTQNFELAAQIRDKLKELEGGEKHE